MVLDPGPGSEDLAKESPKRRRSDPAVVEVYSAASTAEAYLLKNQLEAAGVTARVVGDQLQSAVGGLPLGHATAPRVWVSQADEVLARQVIEQWEAENGIRAAIPEASAWSCPDCGEEVPGSLDACWACGTSESGKKPSQLRGKRPVERAAPLREESPSSQRVLRAIQFVTFLGVAIPVIAVLWAWWKDSTGALAYYNRGNEYCGKGQYERAIASFDKAISKEPHEPWLYGARGAAWLYRGKHSEAIVDFNAAIRLGCSHAWLYYNRGLAWKLKGEYDKAVADYHRAMRLDPNDLPARNALAWLLATCPDGKYRDGNKAVEQARCVRDLSLQPDWEYLNTLAAACAEAGKFEEAVKWQTRSLELAPEQEQAGCRHRLGLYKSEMPYREKHPK